MKDLLVLRLSALGDVIHTLPAVAGLHAALPGRGITWVVEAPYSGLVEIVAGVRTIPVRMKKWGREPLASRAAIRGALGDLRGHRVAVDFQGLVKSAALGWLSGADRRFGFERSAIRETPATWFTNGRIPVDTAQHVVDQNLQLARGVAALLDPGSSIPGAVSPDFSRFAEDPGGGLRAFGGSVVLLPGAGRANKLWPVERFRELARRVGPRALAVWGPGERDLAEAVGGRMAPPTGLRELAWLLRHAAVVIGADTGPLHLAAALGTPTIGLYGPTDPRRNGPYGQVDRCVDRYRTTKLMESIAVDDVVAVLERVEAE